MNHYFDIDSTSTKQPTYKNDFNIPSTSIPIGTFEREMKFSPVQSVTYPQKKPEISEFQQESPPKKQVTNNLNLDRIQEKMQEIKLPTYEISFLGSRLSLLKLIGLWIFDFLVIIPYFILKNFYDGIMTTYSLVRIKEYKKAAILFCLHSIDSLLPCSYIFLFFLMIFSTNQLFYNWASSCFILFCVFLLLAIYYALLTDKTFEWTKISHLDIMGLGMAKRFYQERTEIDPNIRKLMKSRTSIHTKLTKNRDLKAFKTTLQSIFKHLTIDDTYFYYSYFNEELKSGEFLDEKTKNLLAKQMIFVPQKGDKLLFQLNRDSSAIEEKQQEFKPYFLVYVGVILVVKIIAPYILIFEDLNDEDIDSFMLFSITVFYIYIMAVLIPLLSHEDLKKRTYILQQLDYLIKFQPDFEIEEDIMGEYHGDSPSKKTDSYAISQLKQSNFGEITSKWQLKIDVTCIISLETWDNCRRAALVMDSKRSEKYEIIYIFLGIYFFFVTLVLLQALFDVYVFFDEESSLNTPLIIFIFFVDCVIMLVLFFQRIYNGSNFNDTFAKHMDSLETLTRIFEDLINLFSVYDKKEYPINNEIYTAIFNRISEKYEFSQKLKNDYDRDFDEKTELKNNITKVLESLNRIKEQIIYDQTHYEHRFLGILTSDFKTIVAQASIILIPVLPTAIAKISGNS